MQTTPRPAARPAARRLLGRAGLAAALVLGGLTAGGAGPAAPAAAAPAAGPVRIMPLGDSLTWGKGSSDNNGYRADLAARLAATGTDAVFVGSQHTGVGRHEGHPGWRIDQITAHLDGWLAEARPDVVLLDIGTNDYLHDVDPALAPAKVADLVDRITASDPDVRVVLARLLVVRSVRAAAGIRRFNALLGGLVAARPRVTLADMSRIPAVETVDGTHPTDRGYREMAYQWFQALRRVLPGGRGWTATPDPFPVPAVSLAAPRTARRGAAVTLAARLSGRLTAADLGGVPLRLEYRRSGTARWTTLRAVRTTAGGTARFTVRVGAPGAFRVAVAGGRAAGRTATTGVTVR